MTTDLITKTLESIQQRIAESELFNYVDENWGQLDMYGPEIPVKWPCVLIDITNGNFNDMGRSFDASPQNRQQGMLTVELTVAELKLTNSSWKAPQTQKTKAVNMWKLQEKLHEVVHGWAPDPKTGALMRSNFARVKRDDGVQEVRVTYTIGIHDC